jgi:virulence-associated protein VagC
MVDIAKPARTRVFRAGNSRAVRIPKAFDLPEGEVFIEQRDGGLFISPLRGRWDLFFSEPGAEFPYTTTDLRDSRPPRAVNLELARARAAPVKRRGKSRRRP